MQRLHRRTRPSHGGFTIVEILVVVGVIAILLSLVLAGLQAAGRTSRKTRAMSDLRQVYTAWSAYSGTYGDALLPGKIDPLTQQVWRTKYKYRSGGQVNPGLAQEYPFRLMPYLDWNFKPLYGYFSDFDSWEPPSKEKVNVVTASAQRVANTPAFGYNAYYIGGSWTTDASGNTRLEFGNGEWEMEVSGSTSSVMVKGKLVARTLGNITQPSNMVIFCSSTFRNPGIYKTTSEFRNGSSWVVPHILAETNVWAPYTGLTGGITASAQSGDSSYSAGLNSTSHGSRVFAAGAGPLRMEVFEPAPVPYRRYDNSITVLHADGNTTNVSIPDLLDQRKWINSAHDGLLNHSHFSHTP